jgi:hypothetical protein
MVHVGGMRCAPDLRKRKPLVYFTVVPQATDDALRSFSVQGQQLGGGRAILLIGVVILIGPISVILS